MQVIFCCLCQMSNLFYIYSLLCITYHIVTFDCQEQFIPIKCKLCGCVSCLLSPAVQFLLELTLLDAVYAFSLQLPIFIDPTSYRDSNLKSSAEHTVFLHQLWTITKITINRLLPRSRSGFPDCGPLPLSLRSPRL